MARKSLYSEVVFSDGDTLLGAISTVYATKEIVLSAGSIGTPTILQLSGIGPKATLQAVGITAIVNNPSVGQNLTDHPLVVHTYNVKGNQSFDGLFRDPTSFSSTLSQWTSSFTGAFADGIANHIGFLRMPSSASIFKTVKDPAPGPKSSHYELIFSVSAFPAVLDCWMLICNCRTFGSNLVSLSPLQGVS